MLSSKGFNLSSLFSLLLQIFALGWNCTGDKIATGRKHTREGEMGNPSTVGFETMACSIMCHCKIFYCIYHFTVNTVCTIA